MLPELPVVNLSTATYECTFGRGCDGVCCREGRPLVYDDEIARIADNLSKLLPLMRPEARRVAIRKGFISGRRRLGEDLMRVVGGWCIFFNQGCILHQAGAAEGDKYRYKPAVCSLFPIQRNDDNQWYIRQKDQFGEQWDLFCLDPANSTRPAAETLQEELALARRYDEEERAERPNKATQT
jgi:Fe-S-cluster containining protein